MGLIVPGGLGNVTSDTFSGDNSTTAFTLSTTPSTINNTDVFINGVYQFKSTYSISSTTLTFTTAPPTGTSNIQVLSTTVLSIGTPADGTVTTAKLASTTGSGAVVLATSPTLITPALGTPASGNLSNCTGYPLPTGTQTFLGSDVNLNNTSNYFDVVNTGSIGASGQTWLIMATADIKDSSAASALIRIWDGTTTFVETEVWLNANSVPMAYTVMAIVTPSAATTYRLSAKDRSNTTGVVVTTGTTGTANKCTSITAIRLL